MEPLKRKIGYDKKTEKPKAKGTDWVVRSRHIQAWFTAHPLFNQERMYLQLGVRLQYIQGLMEAKEIDPSWIEKIEPIIKKYGYHGA